MQSQRNHFVPCFQHASLKSSSKLVTNFGRFTMDKDPEAVAPAGGDADSQDMMEDTTDAKPDRKGRFLLFGR